MPYFLLSRNFFICTLRLSSVVATVSKCPTYSNPFCQHYQQYSYSILSSLSNRNPSTKTNNTKLTKHTCSDETLSRGSSQGCVYALARHFHTSQIFLNTINVTTPAFPESIRDGNIRLLKKVGDKVVTDEAIAELEIDKGILIINAPQAGVIEAFSVADGDTVTAEIPIAKLNTSTDAKSSLDEKSSVKTDTEKVIDNSSKSTEKMREESSSKRPSSQSTSTEVSKRDISVPKLQVSGLDPNKISGTRSETRVKMTRMRLKIAERLKGAQNTCAMLTTFNEIDMSNIVEFRKKYADQFAKRHNLKLGYMSAFVKASACALVDSPVVNAVIDGNETVYRDYVDISVAVASPRGLVVPVLRNVETMNFADIERAISEFGEKAKKGSLSIEDMDGGTFTISNGGVFGSLFGTPIINPPQSAILGMHGIFDRPVVVNGKIEIRPMMYVALTYDHRLLDGRDATLFLRRIKQYVEDCRTIFLEL